MDERTDRSHDTREDFVREDDSWVPSSVLPTPDPQDGWIFRWIRTSTLGQSDNTNVSKKFREGWIAVKAEDHPELKVMPDINSQFNGNLEVGGLLLCKAPAEKMRARTKHYENVARRQMESVDSNYMRENDPRMPLLRPEKNTRTTFGKG
ncbi:MAG: hypothetical protein CMK72_00270 [Pseudomonadaceae bacterium]|jgi:hypothetical protein|nr:hypothetical protein [Pseudomonadaceae bacterium]|tara:strand:- start:996 stop:1445 length:450 start_codon:yes stop_codon:yes gene_type:complete